ncbi:MAG TPA: App1 family protein [Phycisphaerae bacterium]|nr:App1 family protein [Phycisphaerae bacterium]
MHEQSKLLSPKMIIAVVLGSMTGGCATHTLSRSESVTLQPTICYERADGTWAVVVRGSVYQKSWLNRIEPHVVDWLERRKVFKTVAEGQTADTRLALFLDDNPNGMILDVMVGASARPLAASQGGRLGGTFVLTAEELTACQSKATSSGWVSFPLRTARGDDRKFLCEAEVLQKRGLTIVSDIDDTIKITDVNNTKLMLENTFLVAYRPVPGMAEVYAAWQKEKGASFFYLSLTPVELYKPYSEFMWAVGYPKGAVDLHEIKWGRSRLKGFMELMDDDPEFKVGEVSALIDALPERDYVLVGDSSQHDPKAYADLAHKYPKQVKRILIHDVTCQGRDSPRYQETFGGLPPDLWQIFREASEIRDAVR